MRGVGVGAGGVRCGHAWDALVDRHARVDDGDRHAGLLKLDQFLERLGRKHQYCAVRLLCPDLDDELLFEQVADDIRDARAAQTRQLREHDPVERPLEEQRAQDGRAILAVLPCRLDGTVAPCCVFPDPDCKTQDSDPGVTGET
jgi:hypothetical protein